MERSYLITLKDEELKALIFNCVDKAIKLNKVLSNNDHKKVDHNNITDKKISKKEVANG